MSLDHNLNKILIVDFGSQFTQLIARRIRELGIFCEIISHKKVKNKNIDNSVKGIILSGGPLNVYQINKYSFDKRIIKNHKTMGLERMVPFSSWNLIIFGLYFISVSALGWFDLFNLDSSKFLHFSSGMLLPMSLGMSMLTATVVTYVIIPNEVNSDRDYNHLFKTHEMVMHNWTVILISIDVVLSQPDLDWQLAIFGLVIGIIYTTFAYLFALFGGGYYVYSFIDPRIKYGPIIMMILALAISLFYVLIWLISLLIHYNLLIGITIYILWNYSVVLFKKPMRETQSSS